MIHLNNYCTDFMFLVVMSVCNTFMKFMSTGLNYEIYS